MTENDNASPRLIERAILGCHATTTRESVHIIGTVVAINDQPKRAMARRWPKPWCRPSATAMARFAADGTLAMASEDGAEAVRALDFPQADHGETGLRRP
jgi:hypothetical protein